MPPRMDIRAKDAVTTVDPIWDTLKEEARLAIEQDPLLAAFLYSTVLNHRSLEDCVVHRICERLDHPDLQAVLLRQTFMEMLEEWPEWGAILRVDIQAVYDRDPACLRFLEPVLYFKGFHAIQTHRLANWLYSRGRRDFALYLQSRSSSTPPASSSARRPSSATTCRSFMASRSAEPARRAQIAIRRSATAC
jgi:serine O-acetyltransferase